MQVQSATDPPKKLSLGERSVMADGTEYNIFLLKEAGQPVEAVYPTEGTPFIVGPNGIFKAAPNPNAAKLFQNYCFTPEAQRIVIDAGGLRSLHAQVKEHPGRKPLADIKLMKEDAAGAEAQSEEIKARYQKIFPASDAASDPKVERSPTRCERTITRRDIIKGSAALGARQLCLQSPVRAQAPEPVAITPALVEAAKKEGKLILYSSMDLPVGEKLGKAFEAAYPGISVQIERSGSERLFQRIDQEFASNIRAADVINTSDASHVITWKQNKWLAPFVSEDMAQHFLPNIATPTACPRPRGSICRRSPTTPIW